MWFKKNKWKVILPVVIVLALAAAFYFGGSSPANRGWSLSAREEAAPQEEAARPTDAPEASETAAPETEPAEAEPAAAPEETPAAPPAEAEAEPSPAPVEEDPAPGEEAPVTEEPAPETEPQAETEPAPEAEPTLPAGQEPEEEASSGHAAEETEAPQPLPEEPPAPAEPEPAPETPAAVTLSVSCATVLDHMDWLDPDKTELIPADGWMLAPTELELTEGESVFDLLRRAARDSGLHLEYSDAPLYGTVYIEGIGNLYEMDCGGSSGWMYAVNGWFPNYGCSQYFPEAGDVIAFQYTCDLGDDIGNGQLTMDN